jgi:Zn-dependent protease
MAKIEKDAADAVTEFWVAIVGPITSALIGFICLALAWALAWTMTAEPGTPLIVMLAWLGILNLALAIFNMIPGFPMDGGRVLRAIVWWRGGDAAYATRVAARTGRVIAFGFILLGFFSFFRGQGFAGLWIAMIGWFLLSGVGASHR